LAQQHLRQSRLAKMNRPYILSAAVDGWLKKETDEEIRIRAAKAYNSYQNCGLKAANNLFATGW